MNKWAMILTILFPLHGIASDFAQSEDADSEHLSSFLDLRCVKASAPQIHSVNLGNDKLTRFIDGCLAATHSRFCQQLPYPNFSSANIFNCTYGDMQTHVLVNPDESTWAYAYRAVELIEDLEALGIHVAEIYNWWRPEPYNRNVGGAPLRHPFGTSVDVRMASIADMEKAFVHLCRWRSQGRLKALGYYGGTGLHFGIADSIANTWGKKCPVQELPDVM